MPTTAFAGADPAPAAPVAAPVDRGDVFVMDDPIEMPAPAPVAPAPVAPAPVVPPAAAVPPAAVPPAAPVVPVAPIETSAPVEPPASSAPQDQKNIMLPKQRYDSQKARADRAEQELAALKAQISASAPTSPAAVSPELEATTLAYNEALLDGNVPEANLQFAKMTSLIQRSVTEQAIAQIEARTTQKTTQQVLNDTADQIASRFPELDDYNAATFDPDLATEVQVISDGYISRNLYSPAEALSLAAEMVMRRERPGYFLQSAPAAVPAVPPVAQATISRNAQAAAAQPPVIPGGAAAAPKLNISQMSDAEFSRLSADELSRLRGDTL